MPSTTDSTWGWNDAPFSAKFDPKRFYTGVSQEEAISRMQFLVDNRRLLGILEGPSGCGKSLVLDVCARQFRQQGRQVVSCNLMGVDAGEFLWQLAAGLGSHPKLDATALELWRDIEDRIKANRYQRIDTVVFGDNCEEADSEVLMLLARLTQLDMSDDSRLTIVLAIEEGRCHRLGRRLQELCDLRIEMEPWTEDEIADFVKAALATAACNLDVFTPEALQRLCDLSDGVPRRVQQLAQLAIFAAAAQDLEEIDEDTLDAVQRELSARPTAWV